MLGKARTRFFSAVADNSAVIVIIEKKLVIQTKCINGLMNVDGGNSTTGSTFCEELSIYLNRLVDD